jgi:hypothetical protein
MDRNHWIVAGFGGLGGLAMAVAFTVALQPPDVESLPPVGAGVPASEWVVRDISDPLQRLQPEEPVMFYQFIDDQGDVRFVSTLHEVPEAWRERAGRFELAGLPPTSPASARMQRKLALDRTGPGEPVQPVD